MTASPSSANGLSLAEVFRRLDDPDVVSSAPSAVPFQICLRIASQLAKNIGSPAARERAGPVLPGAILLAFDGIARIEQVSTAAVVRGKGEDEETLPVCYMAPEQLRDEPQDQRNHTTEPEHPRPAIARHDDACGDGREHCARGVSRGHNRDR